VKRAVAGLGALLITGAMFAPAMAVTSTGAVKFGWTVPASFTAHIASDYTKASATFTTGPGTIQTSTSAGSGTCTTPSSGDSVTSFSLSFGTITPGTAVTGCNYQQAIGISVNTNDANGYQIFETLDVTAAPSFYGVCISTDGATATATTPASTNATAPGAATFNASNVATACATGTLLGPASGTVTNPGVGGDVGSAGSATDTTTPTSGAFFTVTAGTPATGTNFYGEDVQLNIPSAAPSVTNAAHAIILYFVPG